MHDSEKFDTDSRNNHVIKVKFRSILNLFSVSYTVLYKKKKCVENKKVQFYEKCIPNNTFLVL